MGNGVPNNIGVPIFFGHRGVRVRVCRTDWTVGSSLFIYIEVYWLLYSVDLRCMILAYYKSSYSRDWKSTAKFTAAYVSDIDATAP